MEHHRPLVLFEQACRWLTAERLVRPGATVLERMIAAAFNAATAETARRLDPLLSSSIRRRLDELLASDSELGMSRLVWLRRGVTSATPAGVLEGIEKIRYLRTLGADEWVLTTLNPNRIKYLARQGRTATPQHLARAGPERRYPTLAAARHWDDMLRVAASLKFGHVTASLLVTRLQAGARRNHLTKAIQELGRIAKTRFLLNYLEDETYRRRIQRQLNKGETLHALRRYIFFANESQIRHRRPEDQTNQALCLNLVTNAVVCWNTTYMTAAIDQLRSDGAITDTDDLSRLSPTLRDHVNPYGRYTFDLDDPGTDLRPLRQPEQTYSP